MNISQTKSFGKQKKKLHPNQLKVLDEAVKAIVDNVELGEPKKGDLQEIRVHKFRIANQEYLLAYTNSEYQLTLVSIGTHENFYRDLKR